MIELVVASAFAEYARGDHISDPEKIREVLASSNRIHVRQVQVPDSERRVSARPTGQE